MKPIHFLVALVLLAACKQDMATLPDGGYNYVRTAPGAYIVYEVDSVVYDDFNGDTLRFRYQLKELIESTFTDNAGRPAQRIERYVRHYNDTIPYANLPWVLSRVWVAQQTTTTYERVEENVRFVRLKFPPSEGHRWNGNGFNTLGNQEYEYMFVDQPFVINAYAFDSTLLVLQELDTNRLYYKIYTERYARNVGLIERQVLDVFDTTLAASSVLTRIAGGLQYTSRMVEWGRQ